MTLSKAQGTLYRISPTNSVDYELLHYGRKDDLSSRAYATIAAVPNKRADGTYLPQHQIPVLVRNLHPPIQVDAAIAAKATYARTWTEHVNFCKMSGLNPYDKKGLTYPLQQAALVEQHRADRAVLLAKPVVTAREKRQIEQYERLITGNGGTL